MLFESVRSKDPKLTSRIAGLGPVKYLGVYKGRKVYEPCPKRPQYIGFPHYIMEDKGEYVVVVDDHMEISKHFYPPNYDKEYEDD